jgi:hypothetical protein
VTVNTVALAGGSIFTYFFGDNALLGGADNCTGKSLAPAGSCTVTVSFTNVFAPRGVNDAGTITFTDNATGSPHTADLVGFATP